MQGVFKGFPGSRGRRDLDLPCYGVITPIWRIGMELNLQQSEIKNKIRE
jgi:hypothetical protein